MLATKFNPHTQASKRQSQAYVKTITSRQNGLVRRFRAIRQERRSARTYLVLDGLRIIAEATRAGVQIDTLLVSAYGLRNNPNIRTLVETCDTSGTILASGTDRVMDAVSPLRTASTAVALAPHIPVSADVIVPQRTGCVLMPIGVQDPGNLGTIIRTAAAAGVTGIIVDRSSADPFGWKALRGAMGGTFRLPVIDFRNVSDILPQARQYGWTVVGTTPRAEASLYEIDLRKPMIILMGNEGSGLDTRIINEVDIRMSIPMLNGIESLNVAAAAALITYEIRRQWKQK